MQMTKMLVPQVVWSSGGPKSMKRGDGVLFMLAVAFKEKTIFCGLILDLKATRIKNS